MFPSQVFAYHSVALDAKNVGDFILIQPLEPTLASKFTVHGESMNLTRIQVLEELLHQVDALRDIRVSSLGSLGQDLPDQGN